MILDVKFTNQVHYETARISQIRAYVQAMAMKPVTGSLGTYGELQNGFQIDDFGALMGILGGVQTNEPACSRKSE